MAVKPIPDGYHTITPYLVVNDAARALDYYKKAFGATELFRFDAPGGKIAHAEIKIGDSIVMLADEHPEMDAVSPKTVGGSPVGLMVYVEDVDRVFKQAVSAGGTETQPVKDQFYGDRSGNLTDPFGHKWTIATHKEDIAPEEMRTRAQQAMQQAT
jgi:PhnB protein